MKKFLIPFMILIIMLTFINPASPPEETPSTTKRNITARVLEVRDNKLYVEVLTGLHLDKVYVKATTSAATTLEIDNISIDEILVIGILDIKAKEESVLLTADYISLPGN